MAKLVIFPSRVRGLFQKAVKFALQEWTRTTPSQEIRLAAFPRLLAGKKSTIMDDRFGSSTSDRWNLTSAERDGPKSKCRVSYYPNSDASFNFMALCIELSGDVHPLPGPDSGTTSRISVRISNRDNTYKPVPRCRVESNCTKVNTTAIRAMNSRHCETTQLMKHGGQNKRLKIAHLNAESLKNRIRFMEVKETALRNDFDI